MNNLETILNIFNESYKFISNMGVNKKQFASFCEKATGITGICTGCGNGQILSCANILLRKTMISFLELYPNYFDKYANEINEVVLSKIYTNHKAVINEIVKREPTYLFNIIDKLQKDMKINILRLRIANEDYNELLLALRNLYKAKLELLNKTMESFESEKVQNNQRDSYNIYNNISAPETENIENLPLDESKPVIDKSTKATKKKSTKAKLDS